MSRVLASDVMEAAAQQFALSTDHLVSPARAAYVCMARNLACKVVRDLCPHASYPMIGALLGGRDHTTIIHAVRRADRLIQRDPGVAEAYHQLRARAGGATVARLNREIADAEALVAGLKAARDALSLQSPPQPGA